MKMETMLKLLCVYLGISLASGTFCALYLASEFAECRETCENFGKENMKYGVLGCLGRQNTKCCVPDKEHKPISTAMPSTEMTSTMMVTTAVPKATIPFKEQCGVKSALSPRILSGTTTKPCDWPWQVSIRSRILAEGVLGPMNTFPWCSGVLIDKQWVLTTAYCIILSLATVPNGGIGNMIVAAGEYNTLTADYTGTDHNEQYLKIENITMHPNYYKPNLDTIVISDLGNSIDDKTSNNFALVRLEKPVTLGKCVHKVCLPEAEDCWSKKECKIAGWGNKENNTIGAFSDTLVEADIIIYSPAVCEAIYDIMLNMSDEMKTRTTCGRPKNPNVDVCLGDNGGMVVCKNSNGTWALEGLINRPSNGVCKADGMFLISYTKSAMDWINDTI